MGIIEQSELNSITFETSFERHTPFFEIYQDDGDGDTHNISIDKDGAIRLIRELLEYIEVA